jgi:Arm DNA-binding domain
MPLNDLRIRNLEPRASRYVVSDGNGLALEVFPTGAKAWRYRYSLSCKAEVVSLGKYPVVSLKAARARRDATKTTATTVTPKQPLPLARF